MKKLGLLLLGAAFATSLYSCQSVKEYNKMYLNDSEMNFMLYREGASGANGGKTGGGCGCN